jgi:hypothetical protein
MENNAQTELDTFLPVGETFLLIVGAMAGTVLERVACRAREEEDARQADHGWGGHP